MSPLLAYLEASDHRIASRVAHLATPSWLRVWMLAASRLGDGWLWIVCVTFMLLRDGAGLERAASLAVVINAVLVVLKRATRRSRPAAGGAVPVFDRYSFPSGHATNAFAACGLLALAEPALAGAGLLLAVNIAVARVALGRHYATDVIAGAALGTFAAVAAYLL